MGRSSNPIKPPRVALLDGDEKLRRSAADRVSLNTRAIRRIAAEPDDITVVAATRSGAVTEIEGLIPANIAVHAARNYATRLLGVNDEDAGQHRCKARGDSAPPHHRSIPGRPSRSAASANVLRRSAGMPLR